ncbi:hypothetical protein I7I48_08949 [Histoplasma ohiense]|nr:hypothetical protein I7I48_08949 [Histoplasma ohiense (nom. inval.)]
MDKSTLQSQLWEIIIVSAHVHSRPDIKVSHADDPVRRCYLHMHLELLRDKNHRPIVFSFTSFDRTTSRFSSLGRDFCIMMDISLEPLPRPAG